MPCLSRLASIVTLRAPARVHPALRAGLFLGATAAAAASALAAPPAVCTAPIGSAATAGAIVVGNGTPASCTESVLQAAINASSVVTFNCGSAAATIPLTTTLVLPPTRQTVIDGGGKVTLDGGGRVRLMQLVHPDFRTNRAGLSLQHITLVNGKSTGTRYVPPTPGNASCSFGWADGEGGAIYVRDAVLHVVDVTFRNNAAETPGPDVGGGAIYAAGSLDVTIVGSTFDGNSGANGGAVGLLNTDGRFANDLFSNNKATGTGANYRGGAATGCAGVAQTNQGGSGGNGGAIVIDGGSDGAQNVCGSTFTANTSNEFGGALFRTADGTARPTTFDRSLFQRNTAKMGGALYVQNAKPLAITGSTFSANRATGAGAAEFISDTLEVTNTTFASNVATKGLGGALFLSNPGAAGWINNTTFTGNQSSGGPGYFGAAIFGTLDFPITNTVFANNLSADGGSPMQCSFTPGSGAQDVQWPQKRPVGGLNDNLCVTGIRFADPQLGALGANGGPTPTAVPASTSPLRKTGHGCAATDQRGVARNTAQCTIGAVE
ncbi:MAG: choice-of-anchor Q domain-containing protein [Vitreoscilla sp.]